MMVGLEACSIWPSSWVGPTKTGVAVYFHGASAMMSHLWAVEILLSIAAEADHGKAVEGWPQRKDPRPQRKAAA